MDGFRFRGIYNEAAFYSLLGLSMPMALTSVLLITFYWYECENWMHGYVIFPLVFEKKQREDNISMHPILALFTNFP